MIYKKQKVIVLGATGNLTFAVANVLMGIKKHSPKLEADFIIFHKDITKNDQKLLKNILECKFIEYEMPILDKEKLEQSSFGRYSQLAFSRYECFRMLDEYKQVLWMDVDILIQKDISSIFNFAKTGISLFQEIAPLQECFSQKIEGFDMQGSHYNSGVMLLSDDLPNYKNIPEWLYEKTLEYGEILKYADQGVINLLIQEFNLEVEGFNEKYNCHPTKKTASNACVVHSYSPQKFWKWYEKNYHYKEWDDNYKKWLKMGGSPYTGITYDFIDRWAKRIDFDCPHPIRHIKKFIKFIIKKQID
jgi:lipopolysaccharide biosynthesis glycosyltransferase